MRMGGTLPDEARGYIDYINSFLDGLDSRQMEIYLLFGALLFVGVVFSMRLIKQI